MKYFQMLFRLVPCLFLAACARSPAQQAHGDGGTNDSTVTYCGDNTINAGEGCDDGNLLDGDGCAPNCTVEPGWVCTGEPSICTSLCGNGVLDDGEDCDGTNLNGRTCTNIPGGYTGGTLACNASCLFDTIGCVLASCGNSIVDPGEECDDGNSSNDDSCMNNCQSARCGDGYVWVGTEECDDGNSSNTDACLVGCVAATCGDGYLHAGVEPCDDGNASNTDACLVGCVAATCGDGHLWAGTETCDDGNTTAGDGCSPNCATEALPVLHWATGQPAVWDDMTLYFAGEPHAPTTPVVAAANADQRGRAYLFTATTYHVLSLPGHQWLESGNLTSRFAGVPGNNLIFAWGVSWNAQPTTGIILAVNQPGIGVQTYYYDIDNTTGVVTPDVANPATTDWSGQTDPPVPTSVKAGYVDLANANGWLSGDPSALCGAGSTTIGPNLGAFTTGSQLYAYEAGSCFEFYDHMPVSQFPPFTASGAPTVSEIVAAFYSSEHGDRLYIVTIP